MSGQIGVDGQQPLTARWAGFWIRLLAYGIDCLCVIVGAQFAISFSLLAVDPEEYFRAVDPAHMYTVGLTVLIAYPIALLVLLPIYSALFAASKMQATPGKLTTRLYIVDRDGNKLRLGRALAREFLKLFSFAILLIGFVIAAFTEEKRALHDILAGTRVCRLPPRKNVAAPRASVAPPPGATVRHDAPLSSPESTPISKLAMVFAGLGAVPALGWPFGIAALIWGLVSRKRDSKRVAALAGICTFGVTAIYALIYVMVLAPIIGNVMNLDATAKSQLARADLTRVTCHVELFHSRHRRYPTDLDELYALNYELDIQLRIADPFAAVREGQPQPPFIYRRDRLGRSYAVYSVGADGIADSADDIFPPENWPCPDFRPLTAPPSGEDDDRKQRV